MPPLSGWSVWLIVPASGAVALVCLLAARVVQVGAEIVRRIELYLLHRRDRRANPNERLR